MRIARVQIGRKTSTAVIRGRTAHLVSGTPFGTLTPTGESSPVSRVKLLVPVQPTKIVAIGLNYRSHAGERAAPSEPQAFLKSPSSLIATGEAIVIPPGGANIHAEAEVVVVIGRQAQRVSEEEALDYVFGYTAGNDVSGRNWQAGDLQWWRAKSSDTFTAVGPWIETDLDAHHIGVRGLINGRIQQESDTSLLIHSIEKCISHISQYMTLERGDLLFTGTPGQTAEIVTGDVVDVEVEGVGILSNPVIPSA